MKKSLYRKPAVPAKIRRELDRKAAERAALPKVNLTVTPEELEKAFQSKHAFKRFLKKQVRAAKKQIREGR